MIMQCDYSNRPVELPVQINLGVSESPTSEVLDW
jgi:hypothetical protein